MKTNHFFIGLLVIVISCQKEEELITTTFQIKSTEYFSGDSIGSIEFKIKDFYSYSYWLTDSTNSHGNYFGSFQHPINRPCEIEVNTSYLYPFSNIQLNEGEHNVVQIELIDLATLHLDLDCSGTGYIQNVNCIPVIYYNYDSPLYGIIEGTAKSFNSDCAVPAQTQSLFSGQWVMNYDWKPTSSSAWTPLKDTIQLVPGQDYFHTIVY